MGATVARVRFARVASTAKLMDKATGEMLEEYGGHINSNNYRLDITKDQTDKYVLSDSENGQVYIWDLVEGCYVAKLDCAFSGHSSQQVSAVDCGEGERARVAGSGGGGGSRRNCVVVLLL